MDTSYAVDFQIIDYKYPFNEGFILSNKRVLKVLTCLLDNIKQLSKYFITLLSLNASLSDEGPASISLLVTSIP